MASIEALAEFQTMSLIRRPKVVDYAKCRDHPPHVLSEERPIFKVSLPREMQPVQVIRLTRAEAGKIV